jgi:hypothetical protein
MEDAEMKSVEADEEMQEERGAAGGGASGSGAAGGGGERQVQIHPLVIVNVADHFTRHKCGAEPLRAIGALFGVQSGLDVAVYDSFEIKYDVVDGAVQIDKDFLTSRTQQCTLPVDPLD